MEKKQEMYSVFCRVTPEMAEEILTNRNNENYRTLKQQTVNKYARKMSLGLWVENAEPIVFGIDGQLLNGQHRLAAIVKSYTAQKFLIVYNAPCNYVYDELRARTWSERTKLSGIIGGMLTLLACNLGENSRKLVSHDEKLKLYQTYRDEIDIARQAVLANDSHSIFRRSACVLAAFCALEKQLISTEMLKKFFEIANTGLPDPEYLSDAPLMFRKQLQEIKDNRDYFSTFEITYNAINAFVNQKSIRRRYTIDKNKAEQIVREVRDMKKECDI